MFFRFLKKTLVFSVVAVGLFTFVLSCENPFSNNLGEKVNIEYPVTYVTSPTPGAFLKGTVSFAGRATAYRELAGVQVTILDPKDPRKTLLPWVPVTVYGEDKKNKEWIYTLETTDMADAELRILFRAIDSAGLVEANIVEYIYIVKNGPSIITMDGPEEDQLYVIDDDDEKTGLKSTPSQIITGSRILGTVFDLRGVKPGYPQIKFWKDGDSEPGEAGWAQLFLAGIDDTVDATETYQYGTIKDLNNSAVENTVNFIFKLSQFTVDSNHRIVYTPDIVTGKFQNLSTGIYHFKIRTSDTFFWETVDAPNSKHPRPPNPGEEEIMTYEPPEGKYAVNYHTIELINQSAEQIRIRPDNYDLVNGELDVKPHIYIESETAEKIIVSTAERPSNPVERDPIFRLRVNAYHSSGVKGAVGSAVLKWSHPAKGSGFLPWDDLAGGGSRYIDPSDHGKGYKGTPPPGDGDGTIFQFTGLNGGEFVYTANGGAPVPAAEIFTSSPTAYTLSVTASLNSADPEDITAVTQIYYLYLDDGGPDVEVLDVRGKSKNRASDAGPKTKGGTINDNAYTVNDSIEVSTFSSAGKGIREEGVPAKQVIKWFLEEDTGPTHFTDPTKTAVLLNRIKKFRSNPTTDGFLTYFKNDADKVTIVDRGTLTDGKLQVSVDTRNMSPKIDPNKYNGKDLWLYVVAQDGLYNLGYTVQKLHVDDDGDKPVLELTGGLRDDLSSPADLDIPVDTNGNPTKARTNVLSPGQNIYMGISDDDGILPSAVAFTLTSHNLNKEVTINGATVINTLAAFQEWNGFLSQGVMAQALGLGAVDSLPDGVYTLVINIPDDPASKVKIGAQTPVSVLKTSTIYFAVRSIIPLEITLDGSPDSIRTAGLLPPGTIDLKGTVVSRLPIQRLQITFDPDVITPANVPKTEILDLYSDTTYTSATVTPNASTGVYTYYWRRLGVNFGATIPSSTSDTRNYNLTAWDSLAEPGVKEGSVRIDTTPPTVELVMFNFGRLDKNGANAGLVNGKVPIEIEALDQNGIGTQDANDNPAIRWFVLPSTSNLVLTWATTDLAVTQANGRSGYFSTADTRGGARYRTIINTANPAMTGSYKVFVIARDKVGNVNIPVLATPLVSFTVDQNTDKPELQEISPTTFVGGAGAVLKITGSIYDDDGFDPNKVDSYVDISFATTVLPNGTVTAWGGWKPVVSFDPLNENEPKVKIDQVTGNLDFAFNFMEDPYLGSDGMKYYRLRIRDELNRGTEYPANSGNYNPEGKNPDSFPDTGLTGNNAITRQEIITGTYSFELKNSNPVVFFDNYDPTGPIEVHPNYSVRRPTYKTRAQLLAALSGKIQDTRLNTDEIYFIYGSETTRRKLTVTPPISNTEYPWNITDSTWLAAFDTPSTVADGMYSITILANDNLGNTTIAEWTFYKDTTPPDISYDNVSTSATRVISGEENTGAKPNNIAVMGRFEDIYSDIDATFDYVFDGGPTWNNNFSIEDNGGTLDENYANWSIPIPGTYNGTFPDGRHTLNIVARDVLQNQTSPLATAIPFIVDRKAPQMITKADTGTSATDRIIVKGRTFETTNNAVNNDIQTNTRYFTYSGHNLTVGDTVIVNNTKRYVLWVSGDNFKLSNTYAMDNPGTNVWNPSAGNISITFSLVDNGYLTENERVFSAARALIANNSNAANDTSTVFTLSGLVYEHNLDKLSFSIRNRSSTVGSAITLIDIDASEIAWRTGSTVTKWLGNGSGTNVTVNGLTGDKLTGANFRVKRAASGDFGLTGVNVATYENRYVWELDVRVKDFYDLRNAANGDDIPRSIAITALDLAGFSSDSEVWTFFMDTAKPDIEFSNLTTSGQRLEDPVISLKGSVTDSTKVRKVSYVIEKWNYAYNNYAGRWESVTSANYPDVGDSSRVSWTITAPAFTPTDGKYKITMTAWDYSLGSTAGGNEYSDSREFYVDRSDPVITWPATQSYYRWDNNQIVFNLTVSDLNLLDSSLSGELKLYSNTRPNTNSPVGTITVSAGAFTAVNTGSPPALSTYSGPVTVTITDADTNSAVSALASSMYTLTLDIKDGAGRKASVDQIFSFTLDNDKPTITITNHPLTEAIVGRVEFMASFSKTSGSAIERVAYKVTTATVNDASVTALDNASLKADGWYFNNGANPPSTLMAGSKRLMEIDTGTNVANLLLYDTRRFNSITAPVLADPVAGGSGSSRPFELAGHGLAVGNTVYIGATLYYVRWVSGDQFKLSTAQNGNNYNPPADTYTLDFIQGGFLGPVDSSGAGKTFGGAPLSNPSFIDKDVYPLTIYLLAIDAVGNHHVVPFPYYVYPAGDYPEMTAFTAPKESGSPADIAVSKLLNGTIQIEGGARDNFRVRQVWFRVLKDGGSDATVRGSIPANYDIETFTSIPNWTSTWETGTGYQDAQTKTFKYPGGASPETSGGWYVANRMNNNSDSPVSWWAQINAGGELDRMGDRSSRDIIIQTLAEDTIWNDSGTGYETTGNWLSTLRQIEATVVGGAPTFTNEMIRSGASTDAQDNVNKWGDINASYARERSAYKVSVKHEKGISSIRWTNAPASSGVSSGDNLISTSAGAPLGSVTTYGIAVYAEPVGSPLSNGYHAEYTVFVDLDSTKLSPRYDSPARAGYETVKFEAYETSNTSPLVYRKDARIPIDWLPPSGMYTHTTKVVGSNATFGGEALDTDTVTTDGVVAGLSRVVLWFSRKIDVGGGTLAERSIVWNELATVGSTTTPVNQTFNTFGNSGTSTPLVAANIKNWPPVAGSTYAGVVLPNMPAETLALLTEVDKDGNKLPANNSCIIIDNADPMGNKSRYGYQLAMDWASGAAVLQGGNIWNVTLNSEYLKSGQVTAHYIVYDKAGNGAYYNQTLMVLNNIPKISRITLATDLGNLAGLQTAIGSASANVKFNENETGALSRIRTAYNNAALTDAEQGISDEIEIDTLNKTGEWGPVFDQKDFMVRNNLLAIKVETTVPRTAASPSPRHYRVEYVYRADAITGTAALMNETTGIKTGKVYIINEPGTFPWGVVGAQGVPKTGMAFLALQDGSDLDAANYGSPSAWELRTASNPSTTNPPSNLGFPTNNYVEYTANSGGTAAEFVYGTNAFSNTIAGRIKDFNAGGTTGTNLDALGRPKAFHELAKNNLWNDVSLFIVMIYDGDATFGDFALVPLRVNNDDVTPPYAQLYDLNPKTERVGTSQTTNEALSPGSTVGSNRTKGGLVNLASDSNDLDRSGHIEPRYAGTNNINGTSLTGPQMGGGSDITNPAASTSAYFTVDTVSGDVIVRGYAEDNQRIARVDLEFWTDAATPVRITIPDPATNTVNPPNDTTATAVTILTQSAKSANGALVAPAAIADRVNKTEAIDLNRHRVEFAYLWPSDIIPGGENVVGSFSVRAIAYNANATPRGTGDNTTVPGNTRVHTSTLISHPNITRANQNAINPAATDTNSSTHQKYYDSFNTAFPDSGTRAISTGATQTGAFYRYNNILINTRPYITGFLRDQGVGKFSHNTRSRQGRYMFAREEYVVVKGFNLRNRPAGNGYTYMFLHNTTEAAKIETATPTTTQAADHGIASAALSSTRHRRFQIPAAATTGTGLVTLSARLANTTGAAGQPAVNTGSRINGAGGNASTINTRTERWIEALTNPARVRPRVIQPWNKEYSVGEKGSELWDDFIMIHIWQSNDTSANLDQGRFKKSDFNITHPDMSIDPANGTLWSSHQEGGRQPGNSIYPGGGAYVSNNTATLGYTQPANSPAGMLQVGKWSEHMTYTGIYRSASDLWTISNSITTYNANDRWRFSAGMWLWGPIDNTGSTTVDPAGKGNNTVSHYPRTNGGTTTGNYTNAYHNFVLPEDSGYYGIETLWYNGSNSSRTRAEPLSLEQFHNPHIVTNAGGDHIHISYYDSKDGSLKYRYNNKNNPGIVSTEGMTRDWVNLDGGADVDDNADATSLPGKAGVGALNQSYIGTYLAEGAYNPNGNESAASSAYEGGTLYTNPTAGTITIVHVQNGQYVTESTPIYTIGSTVITLDDATTEGTKEAGFVVLNYRTPGETLTEGRTLFRIYPVVSEASGGRIKNTDRLGTTANAGKHNSIAVNGSGHPVIAYYNETAGSEGLKIAVSNDPAPKTAANWTVYTTAEIFAGFTKYAAGTGEYVSLQMNGNQFHIAAMNRIDKTVVYIRGTVTPSAISTDTVRVVDSVGNVGFWCRLSLDPNPADTTNPIPWIAYTDTGYREARDGVKVAYLDTARFYKGSATGGGNYLNEDTDSKGEPITGWEAMHVPTQYLVKDAQIGIERFPTMRTTVTAGTSPAVPSTVRTGTGLVSTTRFAAVGYLSEDYYRIAYYVE